MTLTLSYLNFVELFKAMRWLQAVAHNATGHKHNMLMVRCLQASIFGHSMGGHGALTIFLKNSGVYKSVSAFAPICNPMNVQWGQKAFSGYLGDDKSTWKEYDATELVKQYKGPNVSVLIDVGSKDNFKDKQLEPEAFQKAAEGKLSVNYRLQVLTFTILHI